MTESRDLKVEQSLEEVVTGEMAPKKGINPLDEVAPDPLASAALDRTKRSRSQVRERRRSSQPGNERRPEQRRSPDQIAREIYRRFSAEAYPIVFRPDVSRPVANSTTQEDIPTAELSYAAYAKIVAENCLRFSYVTESKPTEGAKRSWRPNRDIGDMQTIEQHCAARAAVYTLMVERFQTDQERLSGVILRNRATNDKLEQADAIKKVIVKQERRGTRSTPVSLDAAMGDWQTTLAKKRWEVMMDVVDWFGVRVSQVEELTKTLTKGTDQPLHEKVGQLDTDAELQDQLKELDGDIAMLDEVMKVDGVCAKEDDTAWVKQRLTGQLNRAKFLLRKCRAQIEEIKKIAQEVRGTGLNKIDFQRLLFAETFLTDLADANGNKIGRKFMKFCEDNTANLAVVERLNFWEALNELCDSVEERPQRPDRGQNPIMYNAAMVARLKKINEEFKIYKQEGKGVVVNHSPDGEFNVEADDQTPIGIEQVMLKAKADAKLLGELRQIMRKTFAMMGKDFRQAVRRGLRSFANGEKIQIVEALNIELTRTQKKAVVTLKANEDFAEKLKDREPSKLKWTDKVDNALLGQIRAQLFTELQLGTPAQIDMTRLMQLLTLEEPEARDEGQALAQEADSAQPMFDQIRTGKIKPKVIEGLKISERQATVADVRERVSDLTRRLAQALHSAALQEVIQQEFEHFVPEGGIQDSGKLNEYLEWIKAVMVDCERLNYSLGDKWVTEVGLVTNEKGIQQVNVEKMQAVFGRLNEHEGDFIAALELANDPEAVKTIMEKIDQPSKQAFTDLDIAFTVAANLLLYAIPRFDDTADLAVPLPTAAQRLVNYLKTGEANMKGEALLKALKVLNVKGENDLNSVNTLTSILRSQQFDRAIGN